jgi:hypothetical protein
MRRVEQLQLADIETFLAEMVDTLASRGMPGFAPPAPRTRTATRHSLEWYWLVHIKQLGANFGHIGTVRSAVDARRVQGLEVQRGKICAEHGKARVQIEVEPLSFDDVGDYCGHLAKQASAGREGLRQALYELIEVRSSLLFPARGAVRTHCTCPISRRVCGHVLAVLTAFGAQLDAEPELLVRLRGIESLQLSPGPLPAEERRVTGDLAAIFGIDLQEVAVPPPPPPPAEQKEVGREHLRVLGLQARTIDAWVRDGVLGRTERHDVYVRTPEANRRIAAHLAR